MKTLFSLTLVSIAALLHAGCSTASHASKTSYFIDVHEFGPGKVTAAAVAEAHRADLAVQGQHGVNFVTYWVDETTGKVLCLSEAPNADAVRETHRQAHGLLPATIVKVTNTH